MVHDQRSWNTVTDDGLIRTLCQRLVNFFCKETENKYSGVTWSQFTTSQLSPLVCKCSQTIYKPIFGLQKPEIGLKVVVFQSIFIYKCRQGGQIWPVGHKLLYRFVLGLLLTTWHNIGDLNHRLYSLTVAGTGILRSRSWWVQCLLRTQREAACLFRPLLLAWRCSILLVSLYTAFSWMHFYPPNSPLYKNASHIRHPIPMASF